MKRSIAGFLILVAISLYLYLTGFAQAVSCVPAAIVPVALALIGLLTGYFTEWPAARDAVQVSLGAADTKLFLSVVGGALASYYLNIRVGLGAVMAAGLVSVLAALILPTFSAPITCGGFVGMASPSVLPGVVYFLLAAVLAGLLYVLAKDVMNGFGGKLGAIAATGCTVAALLIGSNLPSASVPGWSTGKYIVLVTLISAEASYILNTRLKHGPVMGSGMVSITGGLLLPALYPGIGATLAVACACGSYAGMSSRARIPNEWLMAVVGLLSGLVFVCGASGLVGIGGRLGTIALGSVIAVWGGLRMYEKLSRSRSSSWGMSETDKQDSRSN